MADTPERKIRKVVDDCADCDVCRYLMDVDCQFFPELYRLWDKEHDDGIRITDRELRHLLPKTKLISKDSSKVK